MGDFSARMIWSPSRYNERMKRKYTSIALCIMNWKLKKKALAILFMHALNTYLLIFYYVLAIVIIMARVANIGDNIPAITEPSDEMTNK